MQFDLELTGYQVIPKGLILTDSLLCTLDF